MLPDFLRKDFFASPPVGATLTRESAGERGDAEGERVLFIDGRNE
jgi:hypothetical protein